MNSDIDIKKELRACMNGVLSAKMREAGMPFRLIFGVELPRLQSVAKEFHQDADFANQLWNQNIRETRLLAIMLMPAEDFTAEMSNIWAGTMVTAEEAQIMAKMLLSKTNHAKETSISWLKEGKPLPSVCACLTLRHLLVGGITLAPRETELIEGNLTKLLPTANLHLRKAIQTLKESLKARG